MPAGAQLLLLDTTVLVYAKGADHPLRQPSRDLIQAIAEQRIDATTTPEVIQEFVHVRARRRGREEAAAIGRDYAELLSPLVSVDSTHLERGLALFSSLEDPGAFDSVLAAVALETGARLVSADEAFKKVRGLHFSILNRDGIEALLRSGDPGDGNGDD